MTVLEEKTQALPESSPLLPNRSRRRLLWRLAWSACAFAAVVAWLVSGIYVVNADERAVVRRFGRIAEQVWPGMHYRLPWPIDRVDVLKTTNVMKTGAGFAVTDGDGDASSGIEVLTGDTNIVSVALVLHYVVRDPAEFLFSVEDPRAFIGSLAQGMLTQTVLEMKVDEVLTTGRLEIQDVVRTQTQRLLDEFRSGIQITSASIMSVTLDRSVGQSFQDVADAMADREKMTNEARIYANSILPKARGDARTAIAEAQNYKGQRVAEAIGGAERFLTLLGEHEKAPELSWTRFYLETMAKTLPKTRTIVIDTQSGRAPVNLRLAPP